MACLTMESKDTTVALLDKASKLHLDAFSCWKDLLHHYSTRLEILQYEKNSLLSQLKEANEEKTRLHKQYRRRLHSQMQRNNSLQDMINLLTQSSNEADSPFHEADREDLDHSVSYGESVIDHVASVNSEDDHNRDEESIVCVEMGTEEKDTPLKSHDVDNARHSYCLDREQDPYSTSNGMVIVSSFTGSHSETEECTMVSKKASGSYSIPNEETSKIRVLTELKHSDPVSMINVREIREVTTTNSKSEIKRQNSSMGDMTEEAHCIEVSCSGQPEDIQECTKIEDGDVKTSTASEESGTSSIIMVQEGTPRNELRPGHNPVEPGSCCCKECGRWFDNPYKLRKHLLFHSNERPFKCSVCNKRFRLKHHLVEHTRVHTGYRPYRCTSCGKGFNRRGIAELHICSGRDNMSPDLIHDSNPSGSRD